MQVWLAQANGQEPGERLVAEVNPGETIGEIGMLTGGQRSASIRAVRNSLLLKHDLCGLRSAWPAAARSHAPHRGRHRRPVAGSDRRRLAHPAQPEDDRTGAAGLGATAEDLARETRRGAAGDGPTCSCPPAACATPARQPCRPRDTRTSRRRWSTGLPSRKTNTASSSTWRIRPTTVFTDMALHHADLILLVAMPATIPRRGPGKGTRSTRPVPPLRVARWCCAHERHGETLPGTAAWLVPRKLDFHLHLRAGVPGDLDRLARVLAGSAVGLVLGGGAARGLCPPGRLSRAVGGRNAGRLGRRREYRRRDGAAMAQGPPVDVLRSSRAARLRGWQAVQRRDAARSSRSCADGAWSA